MNRFPKSMADGEELAARKHFDDTLARLTSPEATRIALEFRLRTSQSRLTRFLHLAAPKEVTANEQRLLRIYKRAVQLAKTAEAEAVDKLGKVGKEGKLPTGTLGHPSKPPKRPAGAT